MSNKLELTWVGKNDRKLLEPRILIPDDEKSVADANHGAGGSLDENKLIFGDNLLALKALESDYAGKVKCVFIDPPYNTGSAFKQYDDGIEHSIWLSLIRDRLELLRRLMSEDGSLWITIDDTECHYLKVLCDEVFGRSNFVSNVVWQKKSSAQPNAVWLSDSHDHILVYAKNKQIWRPNRLGRSEKQNSIYKHSDTYDGLDEKGNPYGRGPWYPGDATASLRGGQRGAQFARTGTSPNIYTIKTPSGRLIDPPSGTCWRYSKERLNELIEDHRITFGESGSNRPCVKRFLSELEGKGVVTMTTWHYSEVGENRVAASEVKVFNSQDPFSTPKPEKLLHRILSLATNPGDLVLDSFAGSGTTGAVAHKMNRRWIMIEMGEHCNSHIIPRLNAVINGQDENGVTDITDFKGGGGYRYYRLAKSLMKKDKFNQWIINRDEYDAEKLTQAICKIENFTYDPSSEYYWQHGHSTENDFIYVTTQSLTNDHFASLSHDVGENRSLLIVCGSYDGKPERFQNLTVKVLRRELVGKFEWGRETYSLNVQADQPSDDADEDLDDESGCNDAPEPAATPEKKKRGRPTKAKQNGDKP